MTWSILALAFLLLCKILFKFTTEFAPIYAILFRTKYHQWALNLLSPILTIVNVSMPIKKFARRHFCNQCAVWAGGSWEGIQHWFGPGYRTGCCLVVSQDVVAEGSSSPAPTSALQVVEARWEACPQVGADWMWRNAPGKAWSISLALHPGLVLRESLATSPYWSYYLDYPLTTPWVWVKLGAPNYGYSYLDKAAF